MITIDDLDAKGPDHEDWIKHVPHDDGFVPDDQIPVSIWGPPTIEKRLVHVPPGRTKDGKPRKGYTYNRRDARRALRGVIEMPSGQQAWALPDVPVVEAVDYERTRQAERRLEAMRKHYPDLFDEAGNFDSDWWFDGESDYGESPRQEALDEWAMFGPCRAIRRAAEHALDVSTTADPHVEGPDPGWGGGRMPAEDPQQKALGFLFELHDSEPASAEPLYRGVEFAPREMIDSLRAGATFDLPLVSFVNSRDNAGRFGTEVTFKLLPGAKTIEGGQMGEPVYESVDEIPYELRYPYDGGYEIAQAYGNLGMDRVKVGDPINEALDPGNFYDWMDYDRGPHEQITGGRFRVKSVRKSKEGGLLVTIAQVGTFDPVSGRLLPNAIGKTDDSYVPWAWARSFDGSWFDPVERSVVKRLWERITKRPMTAAERSAAAKKGWLKRRRRRIPSRPEPLKPGPPEDTPSAFKLGSESKLWGWAQDKIPDPPADEWSSDSVDLPSATKARVVDDLTGRMMADHADSLKQWASSTWQIEDARRRWLIGFYSRLGDSEARGGSRPQDEADLDALAQHLTGRPNQARVMSVGATLVVVEGWSREEAKVYRGTGETPDRSWRRTMYDWADVPEEELRKLGYPGDTEFYVSEQVNEALRTWADHASDSDAFAIALQEEVAHHFGVSGAEEMWQGIRSDVTDPTRLAVDQLAEDVAYHHKVDQPFFEAFIEATYTATQEELAAHGITSLNLYRGMHFTERPDWWPPPDPGISPTTTTVNGHTFTSPRPDIVVDYREGDPFPWVISDATPGTFGPRQEIAWTATPEGAQAHLMSKPPEDLIVGDVAFVKGDLGTPMIVKVIDDLHVGSWNGQAMGHFAGRRGEDGKGAYVEFEPDQIIRGSVALERAAVSSAHRVQPVPVESANPISSFSLSEDTATRFATSRSEEQPFGYVAMAEVPASAIFSTAVTGPGCLGEEEFIVLGLTGATVNVSEVHHP